MTEEEIIKGCIKKDVACQRMLFDEYAGRLMTLCLRYANDTPEAEDMLQEAFIRIFSKIHLFNFEGSFEGWLKRVTVNVALKVLQKKKIKFSEPVFTDDEINIVMTESKALSSLTENELLKLINSLPLGYRTVFNLYVMEGYSHDEIAGMLKIEAVTSRSQLLKARKILQQQILVQQKIAIEHER